MNISIFNRVSKLNSISNLNASNQSRWSSQQILSKKIKMTKWWRPKPMTLSLRILQFNKVSSLLERREAHNKSSFSPLFKMFKLKRKLEEVGKPWAKSGKGKIWRQESPNCRASMTREKRTSSPHSRKWSFETISKPKRVGSASWIMRPNRLMSSPSKTRSPRYSWTSLKRSWMLQRRRRYSPQ